MTVAANVLRYGTGAINIDGCRVRTEGGGTFCGNRDENGKCLRHKNAGRSTSGETFHGPESDGATGRWPANLAHDGSPEVLAGFPVTGASKAAKRGLQHSGRHGGLADIGGNIKEGTDSVRGHDDQGGSAARFFYCAKASKADRNAGLDDAPEQPTAAGQFRPNHAEGAANGDDGNPYGRWSPTRNFHPTVKPTALMQWLVRLVTPPGGTVLDPFMGSGSTGIAAVREGFSFVGCEMGADYAEIARLRIDHAVNSR